jgi:hypothetical protein
VSYAVVVMGFSRNKYDEVEGEERAAGVTNNTKGCIMATQTEEVCLPGNIAYLQETAGEQ